jgi:CDP-paratose 2-epimerase
MFGGRQFATYDQGLIGWFTQQAINIKNGIQKETFTISGNGKQVRDIAYASDMIDLYLKASTKIEDIKGQAFNVGGGMNNSSSLLELFSFLENELDVKMEYIQLPVRESDQRVFVADLTKAKELIGWEPKVSKEDGIRKMIEWVKAQ